MSVRRNLSSIFFMTLQYASFNMFFKQLWSGSFFPLRVLNVAYRWATYPWWLIIAVWYMRKKQFCPQGRSMNTYSNDQNVHIFEPLERSHNLSKISTEWSWNFWSGDAYNFNETVLLVMLLGLDGQMHTLIWRWGNHYTVVYSLRNNGRAPWQGWNKSLQIYLSLPSLSSKKRIIADLDKSNRLCLLQTKIIECSLVSHS